MVTSPKISLNLLKAPSSKLQGPSVVEKALYIRLSFRKGGQSEVHDILVFTYNIIYNGNCFCLGLTIKFYVSKKMFIDLWLVEHTFKKLKSHLASINYNRKPLILKVSAVIQIVLQRLKKCYCLMVTIDWVPELYVVQILS